MRMMGATVLVAICGATTAAAAADRVPSPDLTLPPEMRGAPPSAGHPGPVATAAGHRRPARITGGLPDAARARAQDPAHAAAAPVHPVDVGVAVRGEGDHHTYSQTGLDLQNGTGASVGVRIGF